MDQKDKEVKLFEEFPQVTTQQWEEIIKKDLKGADYEKKLVWKTLEGFDVKPYYRAEDLQQLEYLETLPGEYPYNRGDKTNCNDWIIRQDIDVTQPAKANEVAVLALKKGAQAVGFSLAEVNSADDLAVMVDNIDLTHILVNFYGCKDYLTFLSWLEEVCTRRGIDTNCVKGSLDFDPMSYFMLNGKFYASQEQDLSQAAEVVKMGSQKFALLRTITVNGRYVQNAGSNLTQELAFAMACGNEYLAYFTNAGIAVDDAVKHMQFHFAVGQSYFMEIAKFRAARLLWARIVEQYKPADNKSMNMFIHASSAIINKTVFDPYVNMLRTTTESMSAALGGVDSLAVAPFDVNFKSSDDFSGRIARNQQIILKEESYFNRIVDPAAGSYYIENLTDKLASGAWDIFRSVEAEGGFIQAISSGFIKKEIDAILALRRKEVALRKQTILGVNQYPNINETMLEKIENSAQSQNDGIQQVRVAEPFETLRMATETKIKDGGKRPVVFLLTLGNLTMRRARAQFSQNFFGCAGYQLIDHNGYASVEEGMKAAREAGADIVVICSSDDEYAEFAPQVIENLKNANENTAVVVAGYPKALIDQLTAAGVDEFIHVRTNALDTLTKFQQRLGIM